MLLHTEDVIYFEAMWNCVIAILKADHILPKMAAELLCLSKDLSALFETYTIYDFRFTVEETPNTKTSNAHSAILERKKKMI